MKRDVLDDAVALVEDAEHRHPLRHRSDAALAVGGRPDLTPADRIALLRVAAAAGKRRHKQQFRSGGPHFYSGIHGS